MARVKANAFTEDPILATSRQKKVIRDALSLEERVYNKVLKDMKRYAESQEKEEVSDQERETKPREWF